jgi:hypothetical protein
MAHGSALPFAVPAGVAGRKSANPQKRTNGFPARSGTVQNPAFGRGRNAAFSAGVFLGICFSAVGLTWLLLANRVPHLDQFAGERNLVLAVAFALLGIVPTFRFMKSPGRSFLCGVTGWAMLTVIYSVAELVFPRLATRLSAFHLFVLGCMVFGLLAALAWVVNLVILCRRARQQPVDARIGLRYAASPQ